MSDPIQLSSSNAGLTVKAYRSYGSALLAFDLDQSNPSLTQNLAGFAIQCTPPSDPAAANAPQQPQPVIDLLKSLYQRKDIFSFGITQSAGGLNMFTSTSPSREFADFAYLQGKLPPPFNAEFGGGPGQVIHDKFVVVDFNGDNPVLFTGSSNLAEGGEQDNGDNLLMITDPDIATAYAVEAIRLVDHYHFRQVMQGATNDNPSTSRVREPQSPGGQIITTRPMRRTTSAWFSSGK